MCRKKKLSCITEDLVRINHNNLLGNIYISCRLFVGSEKFHVLLGKKTPRRHCSLTLAYIWHLPSCLTTAGSSMIVSFTLIDWFILMLSMLAGGKEPLLLATEHWLQMAFCKLHVWMWIGSRKKQVATCTVLIKLPTRTYSDLQPTRSSHVSRAAMIIIRITKCSSHDQIWSFGCDEHVTFGPNVPR